MYSLPFLKERSGIGLVLLLLANQLTNSFYAEYFRFGCLMKIKQPKSNWSQLQLNQMKAWSITLTKRESSPEKQGSLK